jgi:hypothetical protein
VAHSPFDLDAEIPLIRLARQVLERLVKRVEVSDAERLITALYQQIEHCWH